MASAVGERAALLVGGAACILGVAIAVAMQRDFLRYDGDDPRP